MSTALPADGRFDRSRDFAQIALVLGAASIVIFLLGFGVLPFGVELSLPVALASLGCGVYAVRLPHRRTSGLMALLGGLLALLPLLLFALLVLAFEFSPGD